jgi:hypothetical protein
MNNTMKIKFLLPFILLFTLGVFAQPGDKEKRETIKALKVSFITTELNLTSEESAKFWPIYNAFEEKEFNIKRNQMRAIKNRINETDMDKISEKEANTYLNQLQEADEELITLRKKLVADLKPIIGSVKVLKLYKAEHDFHKKLLSKYKDKKQ